MKGILAAVGSVVAVLCGGCFLIVSAIVAVVSTADPASACTLAPPSGSLDDLTTPTLGKLQPEQIANSRTIIQVGVDMKIPVRGHVIAIATAMQESGLFNLDHGDRDSLGLFQQRPSAGWGTPAEILDPRYAATKFYDKLKTVENWENRLLTEVAQAVQVSQYPDAYAQHESGAATIVSAISSGGVSCANYQGWVKPLSGTIGSPFGDDRGDHIHQGVDLIVPRNTPIKAASSGVVVRVKCNDDTYHCEREGNSGITGCGWYVDIRHSKERKNPDNPNSLVDVYTRYCHQIEHPPVTEGEKVMVGQVIGHSGNTGGSSGPHLHFEVHLGAEDSLAVDPVAFMRDHGAPLGEDPDAAAFQGGNGRPPVTAFPGVVHVFRPMFSIFALVAALRTPVPEGSIYTYSACEGADAPRLASLHSGTGR